LPHADTPRSACVGEKWRRPRRRDRRYIFSQVIARSDFSFLCSSCVCQERLNGSKPRRRCCRSSRNLVRHGSWARCFRPKNRRKGACSVELLYRGAVLIFLCSLCVPREVNNPDASVKTVKTKRRSRSSPRHGTWLGVFAPKSDEGTHVQSSYTEGWFQLFL